MKKTRIVVTFVDIIFARLVLRNILRRKSHEEAIIYCNMPCMDTEWMRSSPPPTICCPDTGKNGAGKGNQKDIGDRMRNKSVRKF